MPGAARMMKFTVERTVEVLSATPFTLNSMLGGLSIEWTGSGSRDNWAPFDVVGHLINCELTDWIPRAKVILAQGSDRNFPPFDRYAQFEQSKSKSLNQLLEEFAKARRDSLETLGGWKLGESELQLEGLHPEFGPVTLAQLLATWAVHDLTHIRQIATFMARQYDAAVGPWKEYLSVLSDRTV